MLLSDLIAAIAFPGKGFARIGGRWEGGSRKKDRPDRRVPVRLGIEILEDRMVLSGGDNPPWFPSLLAFEHYDSGRTHLFEQANFGGSLIGNNLVTGRISPATYPTGYNIVYKDENNIFLYGGCYGNIENAIGPYVAKVDPDTLIPIWKNQLLVTADTAPEGEIDDWNYPGVLSILNDGLLYVIYGYRLTKLDPETGEVIQTVELPTGNALPKDTSYNGFDALSDGTLIAKTVYRKAGCTEQGPDGLFGCDGDFPEVPSSIMVSINPQTLEVLDQVTLPDVVGGRPTTARFQGKDYVYLATPDTAIRYQVNQDGKFDLDVSWAPGSIYLEDQTLGSAVAVMNDWFVVQSNGAPANEALSVIVINQADALTKFSLQPFAGFPVPNWYDFESWAPMSVSVDPEHNLIYTADSSPGAIAALKLTDDGLQTVWTVDQRTTEFLALIGPPDRRVLVTTKIPPPQIPNQNLTDFVVWRDAQTGQELAQTPFPLPTMTSGTMVQPYYSDKVFYMSLEQGKLFELTVQPIPEPDSGNTLSGVALVIDVLSNDSDLDGTFDPSTVAVLASPANGSTAVNTTTGAITYKPNFGFIGTDSFTYTVKYKDGTLSTPATVTVQVIDRSQAANGGLMVNGASAGGVPTIRLFDPITGAEKSSFLAYSADFTGGVRLAVGDITGDDILDMVTGPGPGGGPHIRIFDGVSNAEVRSFFAYDSGFTGGVFVTVGDINGDNHPDVITGADAGGGPHVKVFSGLDGTVLASFFAFDPNFLGGVRVMVGDVNGDLRLDLIAAAGPGGGPHVRVFDGVSFAEIRSFMAYDTGFLGGVFVTVGDINGDGRFDLITGAGPGGGLHVRAFDGQSLQEMASFMTLGLPDLGGVRVTGVDIDGDGRDEIVVSPDVDGQEVVKVFDGLTAEEVDQSFSNAALFKGGAFVVDDR